MALFKKKQKTENVPETKPVEFIVLAQKVKKLIDKYMITLGAHVSHIWKFVFKKTISVFRIVAGFVGRHLKAFFRTLVSGIKKGFHAVVRKPVAFGRELKADVAEVRKAHGAKKAHAFIATSLSKKAWESRGFFVKAFNYVAPVICIVFLISIVSYSSKAKYAIGVEYNGVVVGYVEDETVAEEAQRVVLDRINYVEGDTPIKVEAKLSVQKLSDDKSIYNSQQLADVIISSSDAEFVEAYGIYVNDKFIGAVTDITDIQNTTAKMLSDNKSDNPTEKVSFVDDIQYRKGLYLEKGIVPEKDIVDKFSGEKQVDAYYTIVAGDAPSLIAQKVGIPYADLKALNPDIEKSCFVGDQVLINKATPYLSVKVTRDENYDVTIPYTTEKVNDTNLWEGNSRTITAGQNGLKNVSAKVTLVDGVEESRVITNSVVTKNPVNAKVAIGTKSTRAPVEQVAASGGGFMWPVGGGSNYISSYYGSRYIFGRWRFHTGLDIASRGAALPIYASQSGRVVQASWNGSYGMNIVIDHGNGVQTRYAHLSAFKCNVGDYVSKGDRIAIMGRTGTATGIHLHFEIISSGKTMNPLNYLK